MIGLLITAVAMLAVVQPTWLSVTGPAATGQVRLSGAGRTVAPLVPAAAIVLAAAALASTLAGRVVRVVVLVVAAAAAAGAALACGRLLLDPSSAGSKVLSAGTGASTQASATTLTALPALALALAVAGVLLALAGLFVRTPAKSARFEADAAHPSTAAPAAGSDRDAPASDDDRTSDPAGAWDALSRGDDPTQRR